MGKSDGLGERLHGETNDNGGGGGGGQHDHSGLY